mmetsp:Transcript_10786/g.30121  ORF Transcript_10786/g.30121 Transcript_10786/m.30121 type:complete len:233 (-) Transcript_10786:156-854(-)
MPRGRAVRRSRRVRSLPRVARRREENAGGRDGKSSRIFWKGIRAGARGGRDGTRPGCHVGRRRLRRRRPRAHRRGGPRQRGERRSQGRQARQRVADVCCERVAERRASVDGGPRRRRGLRNRAGHRRIGGYIRSNLRRTRTIPPGSRRGHHGNVQFEKKRGRRGVGGDGRGPDRGVRCLRRGPNAVKAGGACVASAGRHETREERHGRSGGKNSRRRVFWKCSRRMGQWSRE